MATGMVSQTYLVDETERLEHIRGSIEAHPGRHGAAAPWSLVLVNGEGEHIELPAELSGIVAQAVHVLASGMALTLTPQDSDLTAHQAADVLGVSQSAIARMIDAGELRATLGGSHRRLSLSDVLEHRERRRRRQYAMLEATAGDVDAQHDDAMARLRSARTAVAAEHRR